MSHSQPKIWRKIKKIGSDISPASLAFRMYARGPSLDGRNEEREVKKKGEREVKEKEEREKMEKEKVEREKEVKEKEERAKREKEEA